MLTWLLVFAAVCGYVIIMTGFAVTFRKHFDRTHYIGDEVRGLSDGGVVGLGFIWPISGTVFVVFSIFRVAGWLIMKYVRFIGKVKQ